MILMKECISIFFRWKDTAWESDEAIPVPGASHMETR